MVGGVGVSSQERDAKPEARKVTVEDWMEGVVGWRSSCKFFPIRFR